MWASGAGAAQGGSKCKGPEAGCVSVCVRPRSLLEGDEAGRRLGGGADVGKGCWSLCPYNSWFTRSHISPE